MTREISVAIRLALVDRYGEAEIAEHFADTSDTLCYATNENQNATYSLIEESADLAIVVGGYNSSNTSHIVELCEQQMPTFFVQNEGELMGAEEIRHFDLREKANLTTRDWLPTKRPVLVALTCGASCPDAVVEGVLKRLLSFFPDINPVDRVMKQFSLSEIEVASALVRIRTPRTRASRRINNRRSKPVAALRKELKLANQRL